MDETFFRFWDRPLDWVADQCKLLGIDIMDLVRKEAGVDESLWRRWVRGACEPSFRTFKPIVYAVERLHIAREAEAKKARRRAAARRAVR